MSDSLASLRRKIDGAGDLESVVRSMKALAASSIGQYESSVLALADYYRTVELGLVVCLRRQAPAEQVGRSGAAAKTVWAVGERVRSRLADAGLTPVGVFAVPTSVNAIAPLVGQILIESEAQHGGG